MTGAVTSTAEKVESRDARTLRHAVCSWCGAWQASEVVEWRGTSAVTTHVLCEECLLARRANEEGRG